MDIRNVGNQGNADRVGDRAGRTDAKQVVLVPAARRDDDARISAAGREAAATVELLAERARSGASDRDALVEAARQRLLSGALDSDAALRSTAERMAEGGFLS